MADLADIAQEHIERERILLQNQISLPEPIIGVTHCLYCERALRKSQKQRRWCDADCRDDYERAQIARG